MEKEFVTYEQALALKELGFDDKVLMYYTKGSLSIELEPYLYRHNVPNSIQAPLKQQVFRWFRENYSFYVELGHGPRIDFYFTIYKDSISISEKNDYSTYEEAENACIDKLIEIANSQKDIDVPLSKQQDK